MTWEWFLVALPAVGVALVALRCGEPVQAAALEDPIHPGVADLDVVVALQVHRDLQRAEVIVLAQVDDLPDDFSRGLIRTVQRGRGPVPQPFLAEILVATPPLIEALPGDPVIPARRRHAARHLFSVAEHRQTMPHL